MGLIVLNMVLVMCANFAAFYFGRVRGFTASAQACFDVGVSLRRRCEMPGKTKSATASITMYGVEYKFDTSSVIRENDDA